MTLPKFRIVCVPVDKEVAVISAKDEKHAWNVFINRYCPKHIKPSRADYSIRLFQES